MWPCSDNSAAIRAPCSSRPVLMGGLAVVPGLPFLPFAALGAALVFAGIAVPKGLAAAAADEAAKVAADAAAVQARERDSVKEQLRPVEIELVVGRQLATQVMPSYDELAQRVTKMRKKFAAQYGFVVPVIKLSDNLTIPPRSYQIRIHGAVVASAQVPVGDLLIVIGDGPMPDLPGDEAREPAFGMKALWISPALAGEAAREGFEAIDDVSVVLTHLSEAIRNNLAQLLSYKDLRGLLDRLEPEYRKLVDDLCPSQISLSGLQSVLKLLLAERVSIRNLHLILEAIAEVAPHVRRAEQIAEHVRLRIAPQICGELSDNGVLSILRLGNRWDLAFHQHLKRDAKGEVVEFDIEPAMVEQFVREASGPVRERLERGEKFALITAPDARPFVRMIVERVFATVPVLSHLEIARGAELRALGTIS